MVDQIYRLLSDEKVLNLDHVWNRQLYRRKCIESTLRVFAFSALHGGLVLALHEIDNERLVPLHMQCPVSVSLLHVGAFQVRNLHVQLLFHSVHILMKLIK